MLTLFAILLTANPAQALGTEAGPFTLSCAGSTGSLNIQKTAAGFQYEFSLPSAHYTGFVKPYSLENHHWEEGMADLIDDSLDLKKHWLNIAIEHGHEEWHDAFERCMPTRNADQCYKVEVPGGFKTVTDEYLSVVIDVSTPGQPKFTALDVGANADLGANPRCELSGL